MSSYQTVVIWIFVNSCYTLSKYPQQKQIFYKRRESHMFFSPQNNTRLSCSALAVLLCAVCLTSPGGTASWSWSSRRKISWTRCYVCRTTCWSVPRSSPRSRTREKPLTPPSMWAVIWEGSSPCRDASLLWRELCLFWSPNYCTYRQDIFLKKNTSAIELKSVPKNNILHLTGESKWTSRNDFFVFQGFNFIIFFGAK